MYQGCPYFQVHVTFEPADGGNELSGDDKVVKVSTPFLADPLAE